MIQSLFAENGLWSWWILGVIFIGIEVLAPGTFFLWFGLAAIAVGGLTFFLADSGIWGWQPQVIVFAVLSLVFAVIGRNYVSRHKMNKSDQPDLNERGNKLIGRDAVLSEAISNGIGRARIGETTWRVSGPDLPQGTKVRVVSSKGSTLNIEEA